MVELYDRSREIFAAVIVLIVPAFITLFARCYVRWTRGAWGSDDWCMVISAPFFAWTSASCVSAAYHGLGAHYVHLTGGAAQVSAMLKDNFLNEISVLVSQLFTKLSIGLMLSRIADGKIGYIWILRAAMAMQVILITVTIIYVLASCHPIRYMWDKSIEGGHCVPTSGITTLGLVGGAFNIIFDWTCALLPIPLLWNLQTNRKTKFAACGLLSLGALASICSIIRLKYTVDLSGTNDLFYALGPIVTYSYAEVGVGMIAANASTLRPLFRRFFGSSSDSNRSPHILVHSEFNRRSLRNGAFELQDFKRDSKSSFVDTTCEGGRTHTGSRSILDSIGDEESGRGILGRRNTLDNYTVKSDTKSMV